MNFRVSLSPVLHHFRTSSLRHGGPDMWTAGCYSSYPFSSLTSSSPVFGSPLIVASLHTSSLSFLPDKQKPTVEKAVDIAKEKKKMGVVDILTKVYTNSNLYTSWISSRGLACTQLF